MDSAASESHTHSQSLPLQRSRSAGNFAAAAPRHDHAYPPCRSSCLRPGLCGWEWATGQGQRGGGGGWKAAGRVRGQENGTSHLCVYAVSSQGLMTSIREESIPSRAISESRQNRETRCSRWVPDFCHRWGQNTEET